MATTWNPSDKGANVTLSNGNMSAEANASNADSVRATESKTSNKFYFEILIDVNTTNNVVGIGTSSASITEIPGYDANGYGYDALMGNKGHNDVWDTYGDGYTTSDIIGIAVDLDNGKIWFAKNNVWQASGNPTAGTNPAYTGLSGTFFPMYSPEDISTPDPADKGTIRLSATDQTYSPPSGFFSFDAPLVASCLLDGKIRIKDSVLDLLDGKLAVNTPVDLLDGKVRIKDTVSNLLDGKAIITYLATKNLDGKLRVNSPIGLLDGKARIKDTTNNLLDGKVWLYPARDFFDGKVQIKEFVEGVIELPLLDISGYTGAVGDVVLPLLEVLGQASIGVDAQGNVTLPGLEVVGFTGANCRYDLPSLGISGTSVVGIVGSGKVVLPIFTVEGQSFTNAIVNGDITLPSLRVSASSIHGSLCIGEVSLPSLNIAATAKVGVVCTGEVTLPCLIIEGEGGHIPVGNGNVTLPLLQVYSTASILADPRDGCHILRHHRWR